MNEVTVRLAGPEAAVLAVLRHLKHGLIGEATARFADELRFKDHGIGLEFKDAERLGEFFQKTQDLYSERSLQTDSIFVSGDHVIAEWTFQATVTEPIYAGRSRKVPVLLHGISVVRIENGMITEWSDYYDGLSARRAALVEYFTEWVEY